MKALLLASVVLVSLPSFASQTTPESPAAVAPGYQAATFVGFGSTTTGATCDSSFYSANCYNTRVKNWMVDSGGYRYTLQNPNDVTQTPLSRALGGGHRFSLNNLTPGTPLEVRASNQNLYIVEHTDKGKLKEHSYKIVSAQPVPSH